MSVMGKGPEDSPEWKQKYLSFSCSDKNLCRICKKSLVLPHCVESGCRWCVECFEKAETQRKSKDK